MRDLDHRRASRNQIRHDVMPGTQRHQDGASSRVRIAGMRWRIPATGARARQAGGPVVRRLARRAAVLAGLPILILGLAAGTAAASSGVTVSNDSGVAIYNYTDPTIAGPFGITAGPDGEQALWFTNQNGEPSSPNGSIGEITTSGTVTNYGSSLIDDPVGITAGPDGALWFTNFDSGTGTTIGEITTTGTVTTTTGTGIDGPEGITVGPDVNGEPTLWFTNTTNTTNGYGSIGEITFTASGQVQQVDNYPGTSANGIDGPTSITLGPNGALWFTNPENDTIGEITTTGTVSNYPNNDAPDTYGAGPFGITAGPDGALWFTNTAGGPCGTGSIERMTTSGAYSVYEGTCASVVNPTGIAAGPDGALWFTNDGDGVGNSIGRITISGTISSPPYTGTGIDGPEWITPAPDGEMSLWFTNVGNNTIGQITTPPLTVTTTSLPGGVFGTAYSQTLAATGGTTPYTWSARGSLPPGLSLNASTGVISGTPTALGTYTFTVQATDSTTPTAQTATSTLAITIGQAPQTITFTSVPPTNPAFGSTYTVSATGGGSGNPVNFNTNPESAGVCSMSGSTVTFMDAGTCIIDANQAGNTDYQAAPTATQTVTVPQEAPVLTWPQPANIAHGVPLSGTQLDATANVAGTFTYSPPAGTVLAIGTYTLTATFTPANTTNYTSGDTVSTQITVVKDPVPPCLTCK
jgi:virginiamycin B lyase